MPPIAARFDGEMQQLFVIEVLRRFVSHWFVHRK